MTTDSAPLAPAGDQPQPAPARVKLFAIGSAGLNVLEQMHGAGLPRASTVAIDSDSTALLRSSAGQKVGLENRLLRGLGSGGDPERGRALAEEHSAELKALCEGAETIAIVAGLGGGSGTGISPVFAKLAREAGALTLVFVIMPFECEGNLRRRVAEVGLAQLREAADLVVVVPNERTLCLINDATSLVDTFKASNQLTAHSIQAVWHALSGRSVMGLPFTDLCRATRPVCSVYNIASADATGPGRVPELLEKLFTHPILAGPTTLPEADSVSVCLLGGPSMGMVEVNRVMEKAQQQAQSAPILMSAVIDPEMGDRLGVLLLIGHSDHKGVPETSAGSRMNPNPDADLVKSNEAALPSASRFVAPPPTLSVEQMQQLRARQGGGRSRKTVSRLRQTQLQLEIVSRGRFDKSEPTIHKGEDLDVPTYIRRGVSLN